MCHEQSQEHEFGCFYTMSVYKNYSTNEKYGTESVKEAFKILNLDEILYCGMTRLRNTILNYCSLCRYVKAIKPKKIVRQSLC